MTIKDVAEHCGVAVSTVSRVLNNHPYVSKDVRERVLKYMDEVHFVPHSSAIDLVKPQSDAVGLVVRGIANLFFSEIIPVIEHAIAQAGYTLILQQIHTDENELRAGASLARSKRLKGLIFLGGRFDYTTDEIKMLDVPFVCCTYTNSFGELPDDSYSSVSIDDCGEAYRAVSTLIGRGHRKIAIILDSVSDHSVSQLRYVGYCRALADAGIELDAQLVEEVGSFGMDAAYAGMMRLLKRRRDFTAVFVIADTMGVAAMKALHENGVPVPEKCSVIAVDGIKMSEYSVPTLTSLVQPVDALGKTAVGTLIGMIEHSSENRHIKLDTILRNGGSVRDLT